MNRQISFWLIPDTFRLMLKALSRLNRGKRGRAKVTRTQFISEAIAEKAQSILKEEHDT